MQYITIIELPMWLAVCVWQSTSRTADVTVTNRRLCVRLHSHESVIFSYFWHSYFLRYGKFVEYRNMHAMNIQLTVVVGADWTLHPWRHNSSNVGGCHCGPGGTQL